jgi:hypothetical protein
MFSKIYILTCKKLEKTRQFRTFSDKIGHYINNNPFKSGFLSRNQGIGALSQLLRLKPHKHHLILRRIIVGMVKGKVQLAPMGKVRSGVYSICR